MKEKEPQPGVESRYAFTISHERYHKEKISKYQIYSAILCSTFGNGIKSFGIIRDW